MSVRCPNMLAVFVTAIALLAWCNVGMCAQPPADLPAPVPPDPASDAREPAHDQVEEHELNAPARDMEQQREERLRELAHQRAAREREIAQEPRSGAPPAGAAIDFALADNPFAATVASGKGGVLKAAIARRPASAGPAAPVKGSVYSYSAYASANNAFTGAMQVYVDPSSQTQYKVPPGSVLYRDPDSRRLEVINAAALAGMPAHGDNPAAGELACSTTGLGVITPACEAQRMK